MSLRLRCQSQLMVIQLSIFLLTIPFSSSSLSLSLFLLSVPLCIHTDLKGLWCLCLVVALFYSNWSTNRASQLELTCMGIHTLPAGRCGGFSLLFKDILANSQKEPDSQAGNPTIPSRHLFSCQVNVPNEANSYQVPSSLYFFFKSQHSLGRNRPLRVVTSLIFH